MRIVAPALGDAESRQDREIADRVSLERVRTELDQIEAAYRRAIERGMQEESLTAIDAAFDEADRLQGSLLKAIARLRVIERARDRGDQVALRAA